MRRLNADGFLRSVQPTHGKSAWPKVLPRSCASRMRAAMSDLDLDELRDELSDFAQPEKKVGRGPRDERILAGFEDIQRLTGEQGRAPPHGEARDIIERLYAVWRARL